MKRKKNEIIKKKTTTEGCPFKLSANRELTLYTRKQHENCGLCEFNKARKL